MSNRERWKHFGPREKDGTFAAMIENIAIRFELTKKSTRAVVEAFILEIREATWATGRVNVPGLGAFRVRRRKARRIGDPSDPLRIRQMTLPASRAVACKVSSQWRTKP